MSWRATGSGKQLNSSVSELRRRSLQLLRLAHSQNWNRQKTRQVQVDTDAGPTLPVQKMYFQNCKFRRRSHLIGFTSYKPLGLLHKWLKIYW